MKDRFKQIFSTIIGGIIILASLVLWILSKIDTTSFSIAMGLGWTYLAAKNSLLTGVTGGLVKINTENEKVSS